MTIAPAERTGGYADLEWKYALENETQASLGAELLARHPAEAVNGFVCYELPSDSKYADAARTLECTVFQEFYENNDPKGMAKAYGPYEDASMFFLVLEEGTGKPVGAMRVIKNSPPGLISLNDIQGPLGISPEAFQKHDGIDNLDSVWDVGTVAVLKAFRSKRVDQMVSTTLYRALQSSALAERVDRFVTILDKHAYENLLGLGTPFTPIMGTDFFPYMGSKKSIAATGIVPELLPTMARVLEQHEDLAWRELLRPYVERITEGIGVPPVTVLPKAA